MLLGPANIPPEIVSWLQQQVARSARNRPS
jgi:hypothetical protein